MKPRFRATRFRPALLCLLVAAAVGMALLFPGALAGNDGSIVTLRTLGGGKISASWKGQRINLPGMGGRVVLINFWATWCVPCLKEIPDLVRLDEKYRSRGLTIVGISLDTSIKKLKAFIGTHQIPYLIWIGDKTLVRKWEIRGLPVSYLLDAEGNFQMGYMGPQKESVFEKDILPLLPNTGRIGLLPR